jgi:hypothetical protein
MSLPCTYCGVRTDVACRHRAARPMAKKPYDIEVDRRESHRGLQFFASAVQRGVKREDILAILKAAM